MLQYLVCTEAYFRKLIIFLQFLNVYRAWPLVSLFDVETDALAFMQRTESCTLDRAVVDKYVSSLVTLDKTEPLFLVEPFYLAFCQNSFPLSFNVSHFNK